MPYITVGKENSGNIDLYYEDHGSGTPVVLIHGWPLSGASWEKQVRALTDAGHRVIMYDRRGFGRSDKPMHGYDYDTLAGDLDMLLTKLNLKEVMLAGFSMGGGEVARYLGKFGSKRVKKAALISAVTPFLLKTADNPSGVEKTVFDVIQKAIREDRPAFLTQFFAGFYNTDLYLRKRVSEEVVRLSWMIAAGASPRGTHNCVSAWQTDFRKDLAKVSIPVLIVHGDSDRICPLEATGKPTAEIIRDSQLTVIRGGPHGLNWTHAEELNDILEEFFSKPGTRADRMAATRTV